MSATGLLSISGSGWRLTPGDIIHESTGALTLSGSGALVGAAWITKRGASATCSGSGTARVVRKSGGLLEWRYSGAALQSLDALDTVGGVEITEVAGRNLDAARGAGIGRLETFYDVDGVLRAAWRGPGSDTFGDAVNVAAGGAFLLADGSDDDAFIRVEVTPDRASDTTASMPVRLVELLNAGATAGNISESDALAGVIQTRTLTLANLSASVALANVRIWLGPDTRFCEVSWNGAAFTAATDPTTSDAAIGSKTITAGSTQNFTLRRTIPAATAATPLETLVIHVSWDDGAGGRAYSTLRSQYRIANAAAYRFYWKANELPVPGIDAVQDTTASLPYTPSNVFAPGVWWVGVSWFDGWYESAPTYFRMEIVGTALVDNPPSAPDRFWFEQTTGGVLAVCSSYAPAKDTGGVVADSFALWWTDDGSAPGSGTADATATATTPGTIATARFELGAIAAGTTVRALVRMRYGTVDSENDDGITLVVTIGGSDAAIYAKAPPTVDAVRQ